MVTISQTDAANSQRADIVDVLLFQEGHCQTCGSAYIRSFLTFECLPLVEVYLKEGISDDEVNALAQIILPKRYIWSNNQWQ